MASHYRKIFVDVKSMFKRMIRDKEGFIQREPILPKWKMRSIADISKLYEIMDEKSDR